MKKKELLKLRSINATSKMMQMADADGFFCLTGRSMLFSIPIIRSISSIFRWLRTSDGGKKSLWT